MVLALYQYTKLPPLRVLMDSMITLAVEIQHAVI